MLRYSIWSLPPEIYAMIYSHLSVNHLAAVQKTCRRLFTVTTPYVWQSVDIESLLQLFPGCISELGTEPRLQIITPCPIPDSYFERFFFYSRFVNCVKITPQFIISGSFQDPNEVAVLASATGHFTLPHVRAVKLTMVVENSQRRYRDEYADYKFWIDALIPQTIQRISFESFSNDNESLLEALISKAPDLVHLDFASETRSSRCYQQIVGPKAMRNVRSLHYSGSIMDPDVFRWFSQMPQLSILELTLDQEDSEDPTIPEVDYEADAFQALTTLKVFTCDHAEIDDQWNLLRQIWKTPLVERLTCVEIKVSEPILPGMREFDQFMSVLASQSPHVSNLRIEASGQPEHFPEIPVELLSDIRQLPVHTLAIQSPIHSSGDQPLFKTLGTIYPHLEDLDLGSTVVEISDLITVHSHLPNLRYLNIGVWQSKTNKRKLERSWFSENKVPFVFSTQPPCGSGLSLRFRERRSAPKLCAYNLDFYDLDLIAVLLATRWTNVILHGDLLSDRMDALRTRIDVWRGRAERNWGKVVECVSSLSKRNLTANQCVRTNI